MRSFRLAAAAGVFALFLAACQGGDNANVPGDSSDMRPFSRIAEDDTVRFTGNEPFWGGTAQGEELVYTTPDNPAGVTLRVSRFQGRGGMSFAGELAGDRFDLAISEGPCSDGMSERSYPFHASLRIGSETRFGCAWTDREPFSGPENP